ncbi:hypothetical protein DIURU_002936 [Diutina rugosa]|uniref:Ribosomal protein L35Ae n=1 Tax=Diutina rugosa TaxID=5481 RepID=A0A642UN42_DIURU|nr:uncharacterized protein DIURU_002936 [Diutina rugosa]KAA8902142.1 hypothetical protein DIURU_002936 [Diutina rugosa]
MTLEFFTWRHPIHASLRSSALFSHRVVDSRILTNIVYVKGKHLSYQRSKNVTNPNVSLIQIEGVANPTDAKFYLGKRIAYVYRASKEKRGSKIRVIWGKVTRTHGNNGVVRANFVKNLPPKTFGASVRVMLYPSNI